MYRNLISLAQRSALHFKNAGGFSRVHIGTRAVSRTLGIVVTVGALGYSAAAKAISDDDADDEKKTKWGHFYKNTALRRKFLSFASLTYNGEPFMTGEDFIKAVSNMHGANETAPQTLTVMSEEQYQDILTKAKQIDLNNEDFLRKRDYIISYSEFLFLLSVLVKPIDQFYRHFRILDQGNTNTLSKEEFLSIESLTCGGKDPFLNSTTSMQMVMFGEDQKQEVDFEEFSKFLHGIQRQCLKAEFEVFSEGLDFITDDEFMRLLLRRTFISDIKKARYIDRLESRPEEKRNKILFSQFCQFMNLLNDFPDFEVAIRMYAITKKPLTKKDFQRAVRASTGTEFDKELVDVIFDVFDEDNDNKLGHHEFISVMKNSIKARSALNSSHTSSNSTGWDTYMNCVRQYMYKSYAN